MSSEGRDVQLCVTGHGQDLFAGKGLHLFFEDDDGGAFWHAIGYAKCRPASSSFFKNTTRHNLHWNALCMLEQKSRISIQFFINRLQEGYVGFSFTG